MLLKNRLEFSFTTTIKKKIRLDFKRRAKVRHEWPSGHFGGPSFVGVK